MKSFAFFFLWVTAFLGSGNGPVIDTAINELAIEEETPSFSQSSCTTSFNGNVTTYELNDGGSKIGYAVWISRKSQRVKAKYFAHELSGYDVYDRYKGWRGGKEVVLMSSGAYASGNIPVGVTVDNGVIVNKSYDDVMDGLVIVYATGGIAVSNIEDGDLYLDVLGEEVDIRKSYDRLKFLKWAESQSATVFQTHLLAYTNQLRFYKDNKESAKRKFLILAKARNGELFHIVIYTKYKNYSLYDAANGMLNYLNGQRMNVVAMVNLDTGMYDIMGTGEGARDCQGNFITGSSSNRDDMTNLLAYEFN